MKVIETLVLFVFLLPLGCRKAPFMKVIETLLQLPP